MTLGRSAPVAFGSLILGMIQLRRNWWEVGTILLSPPRIEGSRNMEAVKWNRKNVESIDGPSF